MMKQMNKGDVTIIVNFLHGIVFPLCVDCWYLNYYLEHLILFFSISKLRQNKIFCFLVSRVRANSVGFE